jgi:two-component system, cell cycle sensor histidine kinase and response regulator CckA
VSLLAELAWEIAEHKLTEKAKADLEAQLRQAQKMEAIGTLAGGIAHDFNNILGAVLGYAEMARNDAQAGKTDPSDLDQVIAAVGRAKELVKQIMAFSRKKEPDFKQINLGKVVQGVQAILGRTLPKMISIETNLADNLPPILADLTQMEQVLLNLTTNAADAMPNGGRLVLEAQQVVFDHAYCLRHLDARPGPYVVLIVTDTGLGMDEETREHIFDPFFTTKEVGKGTGLGLSTTYGIVKAHSGLIQCHSEVGVGTTFKISLPVLQEKKLQLIGDKLPANEEALGGTETILLVDDEEDLRQLGAHSLRTKGYQVLTATSGEEALEIYREMGNQLDLVIMDLGMPGMGGHKCLKEILTINPQAEVVIASGYSADTQVKAALDLGAAGYLAKPFRSGDLLTAARSVLDNQ